MAFLHRKWRNVAFLSTCVALICWFLVLPSSEISFHPCVYDTDTNDGLSAVYCHAKSLDKIRDGFQKGSVSSLDLVVIILPSAYSASLPGNLLTNKRARQIEMGTLRKNQRLAVDPEAFAASKDFVEHIVVIDFSVEEVDWRFLEDFSRLKHFKCLNCTHLQSLHLQPGLITAGHTLQTLEIEYSNLRSETLDKILATMGKSAINNLFLAGNSLTSMPNLSNMQQLMRIDLSGNQITKLRQGVFDMPDDVVVEFIDLSDNLISRIPRDAFVGNFSSAQINLEYNKLTTFPANVYKPILEQMARGTGFIKVGSNHFECDCSLAWLFVDNRHLLSRVKNGVCDNYEIEFENLDFYIFSDCNL